MSVQSNTSSIQYTGNNSTLTPYTIPFYFLASTDIVVLRTDSLGNMTTLGNGTDYTVTGAGNASGGSLLTTGAYDASNTITISRVVDYTQPASYATAGPFPASSHEKALDRLTMMVQQLARAIKKSVRGSDASGDLTPFPSIPTTNTWVMSVVNGALTWILPSTQSIGNQGVIPSNISQATTPQWNFNAVINALQGIVGNVTGNVSGNATTATSAARLTTPRTIGLSGDVTGAASFDGSANATIAATIANLPNGIVTVSKLGTNEQKQIAKAWGKGASTGGLVAGSYGIDTITRTSLGAYTVQLPINYTDSAVAVASPDVSTTAYYCNAFVTASLPTTIQVRTFNSAGTSIDSRFMLAVFAN